MTVARRGRGRDVAQDVSLGDLMKELTKITRRLDDLENTSVGTARRR